MRNTTTLFLAIAAATAALPGIASAQELAEPAHIAVAPLTAVPPAPPALVTPADSLYRAARQALNRGEFERAANLFERIAREQPNSSYAPDALYWKAFALYRMGDESRLREALAALEEQRGRYPDAPSRSDAEALATRIRGALARSGDAESAEAVAKAAATPTNCSGEDDDVRTAAINALMHMDAQRAMPILEKVLAQRDECSVPLRRRAVFILSQHATERTEEMMLSVAQTDPDVEVRAQAVFWLSQVPTDRAVSAIEEILHTETDPKIQRRAMFALSQHPSERAGDIMRDYAARRDVDPEIRRQAIHWISQRPSRENAVFLRDLYHSLQDSELRERILFSLSQMQGMGNGEWLLRVALDQDEPLELRKRATFWAAQSGVPARELGRLYDGIPDRELRQYIIFTLTQSPDPEAIAKLIQIARSEKDPELRKKAIFWLGQSNDPRATDVLLEIIGG